jgi:MoaA/NifB/PqqE/SkfB family radical SAM enzyme
VRGKLPRLLLSGKVSMANFAITNACNASCRHCSFPSVRGPRTVSLEDARVAIDRLWDLGVGVLSVTGGEPFTVSHLPEIVEHASRRGMVVYTGTNGSLTTSETVEGLAEAGVDAVWVSVEAADPAALEAHRGLDGLSKDIERTVRLLKGHGIPTYAICAINRNVLDIDRYLEYVHRLGFRSVKFDYPMTSTMGSSYLGYSDDQCLRLSVEERERIVEGILSHKDDGSPVGIINPTRGLRGFLDHGRGRDVGYRCPAGRYVLYLDWDLNLFRCTQSSERFGDVMEVVRDDLRLSGCEECYYQGCRDYGPLYHLASTLRGIERPDGRLLGSIRTAIELGRTDLL